MNLGLFSLLKQIIILIYGFIVDFLLGCHLTSVTKIQWYSYKLGVVGAKKGINTVAINNIDTCNQR